MPVPAQPLIQDAFGNYIVQYVLELAFEESSLEVVDQMCGHFAHLSREKFGSNVVEKCVQAARRERTESVHQLQPQPLAQALPLPLPLPLP